MIGSDGITQINMHGANGVAFIQSNADSAPGATDTGFSSITLVPQSGFGFTAGNFSLDELNGQPSGDVTFTAFDQFGNSNSATLPLSSNGQNPYTFTTWNNELVTKFVIGVATGNLLEDLKQVSVSVNAAAVTPILATLPLFAGGIGLISLLAGRRKRKAARSII